MIAYWAEDEASSILAEVDGSLIWNGLLEGDGLNERSLSILGCLDLTGKLELLYFKPGPTLWIVLA